MRILLEDLHLAIFVQEDSNFPSVFSYLSQFLDRNRTAVSFYSFYCGLFGWWNRDNNFDTENNPIGYPKLIRD